MTTFDLYTIDSAPAHSQSVLRQLQEAFSFIPNLAAKMAASPVLISSFITVFQQVHSGSFTEAQIQTLLLTNAVTNRCRWAVAFHSFLALKEGLAQEDVQAIRAGGTPKDTKHAALSALARNYIEKRGHLSEHDLDNFLHAGFGKEHVLEVITAVAASTITNYVGNVTNPPLEEAFQAHAWTA
jgi:alkylhydroperoxidase family enzyme